LKTFYDGQKNEFRFETTNQGIFVASYPHKKRDINQLMNKTTLSRPYQMYPLQSFKPEKYNAYSGSSYDIIMTSESFSYRLRSK